MQRHKSTNMNIRMTPMDVSEIDALIDRGHALNTTDFVRQAVREKIEKCKQKVAV